MLLAANVFSCRRPAGLFVYSQSFKLGLMLESATSTGLMNNQVLEKIYSFIGDESANQLGVHTQVWDMDI